jgi:hypothetical protein
VLYGSPDLGRFSDATNLKLEGRLLSGLKQFDRIPVGILELNLLPSGARDDVTPERHIRALQDRDERN